MATAAQPASDAFPIDVWVARDEELPADALERCAAMLDASESERRSKFRFERHRRQYTVAHAMVRVALSSRAPVAPQAWRFDVGEYGRPEIAASVRERAPGLHFNLSHTDGMSVCAVSRSYAVGVDVEHRERGADALGIADTVFSARELADLHRTDPAAQLTRFYEYWTLKESYIKARGMGLSLPLDQFSFLLPAATAAAPERRHPSEIAIDFDPRMGESADDWQFELHAPNRTHQIALATRHPQGTPVRITWRTFHCETEPAHVPEHSAAPSRHRLGGAHP